MIANIRNISIIAHIDAGKTSTTEGFLYYSGLTHRYGNIDEGTTVMDFLPEERSRGITIAAAAANIPWKDYSIHLIDTPGHIDFTAEVERALRVIDGAVVVFSAVEGVEAQSEKVWRQADTYGVPKIAFVNKMDRIGAAFADTVAQIEEKFAICALPLYLPLGSEDAFVGLIDVLTGEQLHFGRERQAEVKREPLTAEQQQTWQAAYEHAVEQVAELSEEVAELFLTEEEVSPELLQREIRRLTLTRQLVPVFAGSAKMSIGIQPLLDGVINYLPSPLEVTYEATDIRKNEELTISSDPQAPFSGFIFKVNASSTADLFFVRIYSGVLSANANVFNSRTQQRTRARQLYRLYAKSIEPLQQAGPGEIIGITGLRDCGIGDTLCEGRPLLAFGKIGFPDPVISMVVEPKFSKDKDRLSEALEMLCREDQTLSRSMAEDTGQRLLSGMGELHLEVNLKRITTDFNVEIRCGEPRVAYRETFREPTVQKVVFDKILGETQLFAAVKIAFQPLTRGGEVFAISSSVRAPGVPRVLLAAAERALHDGLKTGGRHGYPMIYVGAEVQELEFTAEHTTEGAVAGAVLQAIDQALNQVETVLLEPVMYLEVTSPEDTIGEISVYLQPRRALIRDIATIGSLKRIICEVPLAEMFGFGKALPRLSGGRGTFTMEPSGYQELPASAARRDY